MDTERKKIAMNYKSSQGQNKTKQNKQNKHQTYIIHLNCKNKKVDVCDCK